MFEKEIEEKMKIASKNNNFERIILLFSDYLKKQDGSINDYNSVILSFYHEALMRLNKKDKERSLVEKLVNSNHNNFLYQTRLIKLYLDSNKSEKIENILEDGKLKYYILGKICFLNGQYDLSLKMFDKYLNNKCYDGKHYNHTQDYIKKINNHLENNSFIEIYYDKFKEQGNKLEPGYIIYADRIGNRYNITETNLDPHKKSRPYLVWKVNPEHVFVLPLSTSTLEDSYILKKDDYPNLKKDSTIFENFILLKDEDITSVVEHLSREDYLNITRYIYEKILSLNKENRKTEKVFISNYMKRMKIKDNDIIIYHDNGKNTDSYFFIISSSGYKYDVISVEKKDNSFIISDKNKTSINKKKTVYDVIRLSEEEKNSIIIQLESAYLIQDLCGKKITTNDKEKFVILHDLKDDYLTVSIPYSSSYVRFKLISKDVEFNIDGEISEEELETLRYQLDENIKIKKLCIPGYTNENPRVKIKNLRYKEKK